MHARKSFLFFEVIATIKEGQTCHAIKEGIPLSKVSCALDQMNQVFQEHGYGRLIFLRSSWHVKWRSNPSVWDQNQDIEGQRE